MGVGEKKNIELRFIRLAGNLRKLRPVTNCGHPDFRYTEANPDSYITSPLLLSGNRLILFYGNDSDKVKRQQEDESPA